MSNRGRQQAAAVAKALSGRSVGAVYTSPLARAEETAGAIARSRGAAPIVEAAFREIHLGQWQGRSISSIERQSAGPFAAWRTDPGRNPPPGGETFDEAAARLYPGLQRLARSPDESVAVVTHSIIGRLLICLLLGVGLDLAPRLKLKTASISIPRRSTSGYVLEQLGDVGHLPS